MEGNNTIAKIKSNYMKQYEAQKERENRRKRLLYRRLSICVLVIALLFGSLTVYHLNQRTTYAEKKAEYEQLSAELIELEAEQESLLEEINLLNDEEYVLDIARTNYFLSKKGELIFQIEDENRTY